MTVEYRQHEPTGLTVGSDGTVIGPSGKVLKPAVSNCGYERVAIYRNGKQKRLSVHRLVAETFFGEPTAPNVNHKDGNKRNNAALNLEWCTPSENSKHAVRTGLWNPEKAGAIRRQRGSNAGAKNGRAKLTPEQVQEIRGLKYGYGDAPWKRYGISDVQFYNVRKGVSWQGAAA